MAWKLAVLTSHPIQYQAPLFRLMSAQPEIDLTVYFCWDFGVERSFDKDFGITIKWDIPLLEGYRHVFLKNYSPRPSSGFWGQINPAIVREMRSQRYDAILIYGWNSFTNWLAFGVAFASRTPVFLRGESPLRQELLRGRLEIFLKKLAFEPLFKRIAAFFYIGRENKMFYEYYGVPARKLFFAPYAVDNERFVNEANRLKGERDNIRTSLGVKRGDFVVLFMGKLIPKKRPDVLLKAYKLLITNYQLPITSHLFFVGDGMLRGALETYIQDWCLSNVHFEGFKNQTELPRYYAAADVLVLPSGPGETWGLAVNEAMCFNLPIIVSDMVGCAPDLVREGENGFTVPLGNSRTLADRLATLANHEDLRSRFGEVSCWIVSNYDYEEDIKGIRAALANIL